MAENPVHTRDSKAIDLLYGIAEAQAGYLTAEQAIGAGIPRSTLGYHAGAWTLPGGGIDHGEPPAAALARGQMAFDFTDEGSLCLSFGLKVGTFEGDLENTKITFRADLQQDKL